MKEEGDLSNDQRSISNFVRNVYNAEIGQESRSINITPNERRIKSPRSNPPGINPPCFCRVGSNPPGINPPRTKSPPPPSVLRQTNLTLYF